LERLISKRAFVVCATHYRELETLSSLYSSVSVREMRIRENGENGDIEYLYQMAEGSVTESGYGIAIASQFLPPDFIADARLVHQILSASTTIAGLDDQRRSKGKTTKRTGDQAKAALIQRLMALRASSLDDQSLVQSLLSLRNHCRSKPP
jgi:DNA mismatch repair ATPase MutS